jgi:hypothetical protein
MRPAFCLVLLLAAATVAHAQEQERKLMDRVTRMDNILRPDLSKQATEQTRSFSQGKSAENGKTARTKSFYSPSHVQLKEYNAKSFYDGRGYWNGAFKFETKAAETKPKFLGIFPMLKRYDTKAVEVKDAREGGKNYAVRDYEVRDYETREYRGRETAAKTGKSLSIDEVRELLNKNK